MTAHEPWTQTHSGAAVDLINVSAAQLHIPDLMRSICRLPRYLAHTKGIEPWTVGAHCLLVADILEHLGAPPLVQFGGLVHDLPEAIYGDMPSPVGRALAELGGGEAWAKLRAAVDAAVLTKVDVPGLSIEHPLVKRADLIALAIERRDLMEACERDWNLPEYAMAWPTLSPTRHASVLVSYEQRWTRLVNECQ